MATAGNLRSLRLPTFRQFQQELDQLFDGALPLAAQAEAGLRGKASTPLALWEDAQQLTIEMELPSVQREDIDITIDRHVLKISAERKLEETNRNYWHQERVFGKLERMISLPETVAADQVEADLKDGLLTIRLPKRPEVQPRKINIRLNEEGEAK